MNYTIKQAAERANLTVHTLRYYDKEGLLPFLHRDKGGNRVFGESDLEWLGLICCLKNTGMPIKQIGTFIQWCLVGDETLDLRRQMLLEHRQAVIQQLAELNHNLEKINSKIDHYNHLCDTRNEQIPVQLVSQEIGSGSA